VDEFGAEFNGVVESWIVPGEDASADAVAGLDNLDINAGAGKFEGSGESGYAGSEDEDVRRHREGSLDASVARAPSPAREFVSEHVSRRAEAGSQKFAPSGADGQRLKAISPSLVFTFRHV